MAYDAVEMLNKSRSLAEKNGFDTQFVAALIRLCTEKGFSSERIQEIIEVGVEKGKNALVVKLYREGCKVGQINGSLGIPLRTIQWVLKGEGLERHSRSKWKSVLEFLTEKQVLQVMCKVVREPKFWSRKGRLHPSVVLKELGFPKLADQATTTAWEAVVERYKIPIGKVPFIIKYREGRDPENFLREHHSLLVPEIAELLNRGQKVRVSPISVSRYMQDIGIALGRGRRGNRR